MRCTPFVLALVACTHHRPLSQVHEVEGEVEVKAVDGNTYEAVAVRAQGGNAFAVKSGGWVNAEAVVSVTDTQHGVGALEGLGLGAAIGVGIGAIAGYADGDDECNSDGGECFLSFSAGDKAVLGGILIGILGGGIGLIVGAMKGADYVYEGDSKQALVKPIGPPGSIAGVTVNW